MHLLVAYEPICVCDVPEMVALRGGALGRVRTERGDLVGGDGPRTVRGTAGALGPRPTTASGV